MKLTLKQEARKTHLFFKRDLTESEQKELQRLLEPTNE